jgi:hypothetical protein
MPDNFRMMKMGWNGGEFGLVDFAAGEFKALSAVTGPATQDYNMMCPLGPNQFAVTSQNTDTLQAYEIVDGVAQTLGNAYSFPSGSGIYPCRLSDTDVAVVHDSQNRLYRLHFDGTDWAQVGNSLVISSMTNPSICEFGTNRVAYIDSSNDDLRVYENDGSDWSQVGSDTTVAITSRSPMVKLNDTDIVLSVATSGWTQVMRFNGSTFSVVGNPYYHEDFPAYSVAFIQEDIIGILFSTHEFVLFSWDGSDFAPLGPSFAGSTYSLGSQAIIQLPENYAVSGTVALDSEGVEGATVQAVRQSDNFVLGTAETDSEGAYQIENLLSDDLVHITARYENGGKKYNALSLPDVTPVAL